MGRTWGLQKGANLKVASGEKDRHDLSMENREGKKALFMLN